MIARLQQLAWDVFFFFTAPYWEYLDERDERNGVLTERNEQW